ncbi:AAA family ATPase [Halomonas urmiana]|uniref:AAA family ATPase n=1 Tax=Halomonas urmiana TaxID=490901 RepID=A0A5R8ML81_9GAMM|nr:ATP-binding protein [Halomonas urmiana]TLF52865.1 AAA family ATPase [Halomonas urmiana]
MNAPAELDWIGANQQWLVAEFARLRALLGNGEPEAARERLEALRQCMERPPAIDILAELFGLSGFERDVILLAAGVEMDARLAVLCAEAAGRAARGGASFGLALAALPEPHWSALAPLAPLRRWRLLEVEDSAGLTAGRLRLDERVLHYLAGLNYLDHRLAPLLQIVPPSGLMSERHAAIAETAARRLERRGSLSPVLLGGDDAAGQEDVAATIARRFDLNLFRLRAGDIPGPAHEQEALALLWQREAALLGGGLLIVHQNGEARVAARLCARMEGLVILAGRQAPELAGECFPVDRPDAPEQRRLWREALGRRADSMDVDALAGQFRLGARRIAALAGALDEDDGENGIAALQRACRGEAPPMTELAQPVPAQASWDELVLPEAQLFTLRQIAVHARHRLIVHHDWGFAGHCSRGLGIATLFWGDSGTGKTLAAEVLARDLDLALYRIDLSAVVSKYIGETEKNLRKVFDDAEELGAILLFDEADALFGKRSEVKDSHDRYANIEVSYLLQRMETYRGLAILTTNHKATLDSAFARRLRFVVHFPFPDTAQRECLWRGVFPAAAPRDGLDYAKLARLAVPGGTIRNIALTAAFLAAEAQAPVAMNHLLRAAHIEATKRDKPISESETRGWI